MRTPGGTRFGSAKGLKIANRFAAGDPIALEDVCTGEAVCNAAHGVPAGVICPGHSTPTFIAAPDYTCTWNGTACAKVTP